MKIEVVTLFPEMFIALNSSITGKALERKIFDLQLIHLRDYATNPYGTVDDYPFGGEDGMVLKPEPLHAAIQESLSESPAHTIFLTPDGVPYTQKRAKELVLKEKILIICGHYKGIDERIRQKFVDEEISMGDYVLSGGEIPAMALIDSLVRLLPNAVTHAKSVETDSFSNGSLLGWPVYTRPEEFEGERVPEVLLSGHHAKIAKWREEISLQRTRERRPDLLSKN